jgi:hypothetical protein
MSNRIIEGPWEEIVQRDDLRGHRVRVVVVDEPVRNQIERAQWISQLRAWANTRPAIHRIVDDSRESIYGGTLDDPR